MATDPTGMARYNLVLPETLYQKVQRIAQERHSPVVEVLRKFIKLGLLVEQALKEPDTHFIMRTATTERELVLL